jgi:dnd system-associated protein 4
MPRRVRRPLDKSDLLNQLRDREKQGPFETYKDALVFAAALGFEKNERLQFDKSDEPIDWDVFKGSDRDLINMMAVSVKKDLNILSEEENIIDEKLRIFEEFANGGLEIIKRKISESTEPILQCIVDLLAAAEGYNENKEDLAPLDELVKEISKLD